MGERPAVSIVLCTRNRAKQLPRCLARIGAMTTQRPFELIAVDNGSTDNTREVLDAFAATASFPVHVLSNPLNGMGRARNAAVARAQGAIIAFTDDDCYVAPDYVDRACELFADPAIGFCGGHIDLFDPTDAPVTITVEESKRDFPPNQYVPPGTIQGANMLFRRSVLDAIEGFDPDFGAGTPFSCGDGDAAARAAMAGFRGTYGPDVKVAHHHGRKEKDVPALKQGYAVGIGGMMMKLVLRRDTRWLYLKHWYWHHRMALSPNHDEQRRLLWWEWKGALLYLRLRLARGFATASQ